MIDKHKKRLIGRKIGHLSLRLFAWITGGLPLWWSYFVGWAVGNIFYLFAARHRNTALESLAIAFPEKSARERGAIAQKSIIVMMQGGLEFLCSAKKPQIFKNIRIEGIEYLDRALEKKKGVIGVTAHFGNFPLMSVKFATEGYPTNAIARPMRDPEAGDFIFGLRKYSGLKIILSYPRQVVVRDTIKALRQNELVLVQMDQNFGTGGVWVEFFGKLAATPVGPIVFGLRTGAELLPIFIVHEGLGRHCIKILPPPGLERKGHADETVLLNAIKFSKIIENMIREYPVQWGWVHHRWKSRPSEHMLKAKFKVQKI
ncbi:MAG: lysophospholipid acyltransferase family protein [Candidatus Omnitrophota bacterium]